VPIEPDEQQLKALAAQAARDDGPVIMLNLNKYRDREEYLRYGEVALRVLARVGGRLHWHADALGTVIGDETDAYDEILAVWYPSRAAFLELATDPESLAAHHHRVAGLERAAIVCCSA
jgi:uncharacterized protein (DUF1330 family)